MTLVAETGKDGLAAGVDLDEALRAWLESQARFHNLTYLLAHADDGVIWGHMTHGPSAVGSADDEPASAFLHASLVMSDTVATPQGEPSFPRLRTATLQNCRIFGPMAEVLLWLDGEEWRARLLQENESGELRVSHWRGVLGAWPEPGAWPSLHAWSTSVRTAGVPESLDEQQILWGTSGEECDTFTLLRDGEQGLRHAVPLTGLAPMFGYDGAARRRPVRLRVRHYIDSDRDTGVARLALSRLVDIAAGKELQGGASR